MSKKGVGLLAPFLVMFFSGGETIVYGSPVVGNPSNQILAVLSGFLV